MYETNGLHEKAQKSTSLDYVDYAGFWIRFISFIIDIILILIISLGIIFFIALLLNMFQSVMASFLAVPIIVIGVIWLYEAGFQSSSLMATPGKILCGVIVTDVEGKQIDFGQATIRVFCKMLIGGIIQNIIPAMALLVSIYGAIDGLSIVANKNKRSIHDFIAGTYVIHKEQ